MRPPIFDHRRARDHEGKLMAARKPSRETGTSKISSDDVSRARKVILAKLSSSLATLSDPDDVIAGAIAEAARTLDRTQASFPTHALNVARRRIQDAQRRSRGEKAGREQLSALAEIEAGIRVATVGSATRVRHRMPRGTKTRLGLVLHVFVEQLARELGPLDLIAPLDAICLLRDALTNRLPAALRSANARSTWQPDFAIDFDERLAVTQQKLLIGNEWSIAALDRRVNKNGRPQRDPFQVSVARFPEIAEVFEEQRREHVSRVLDERALIATRALILESLESCGFRRPSDYLKAEWQRRARAASAQREELIDVVARAGGTKSVDVAAEKQAARALADLQRTAEEEERVRVEGLLQTADPTLVSSLCDDIDPHRSAAKRAALAELIRLKNV